MKKVLAILIAMVLVFSLVACNNGNSGGGSETPASVAPSSGGEQPAQPAGEQYAEHIDIMSNNVVPAVINAFSNVGLVAPAQWIYTIITDPLIWHDDTTGEYGPMLATKWETNDNKTIRFYLREDVYFHNGEHFTAEDVKWTAEISRDYPGSGAFTGWQLVEEVNVIDTYTVDLVLGASNAGIFSILSMPYSGIYNSKAFAEQPDDWFWVGTGPFMITDFSTNEYTTVTRNENFWGGVPKTKTMTFRFVPEESVRTIMMLNNDYQISLGIIADDFEVFEADPNFKIVSRYLISPLSVGFNMTDPLTSDYNFRMAVMHALDGYEVGVVAEGVAGVEKIDGNVWGYDVGYRKTGIPNIEHNIDKAKEYLANSPYKGETITITAGAPPFIRGSESIQSQLLAIGINCEVNPTDQPGLFSLVAFGNNTSQLHFFCPEMIFDPFISARNNFTASALNRTSYTNPVIEDLIVKAEASTDSNVHRDSFYEIQDIVAADPPWFPCVWRVFGDVMRTNVYGYGPSTTATRVNFRDLYMVVE